MSSPLVFRTKRSSAVEWLRSQILSGALPPGVQLEQEAVAAEIGLSPTPVREAFAQLEMEGLVESRPHRGMFVARIQLRDVIDAIEARAFVETRTAARAAAGITGTEMDHLDKLIRDATEAEQHRDDYRFRQANADFHIVLAEASGSKVHASVVRALVSLSIFTIPISRERSKVILREHVAIHDALRRHQTERVRSRMREHLAQSLREVRETSRSLGLSHRRRAG